MPSATEDRRPFGSLWSSYQVERARADIAHQRLRAIRTRPHTPAEVREAARELAAALQDATATATRGLLAARPPHRVAAHRHHRATRSLPVAARRWSIELARLGDIAGWLRRVTMDELGVLVPASVQIGSRAASSPHIAGLCAESDSLVAQTLHEPRIGLDVTAAVDAVADSGTGRAS